MAKLWLTYAWVDNEQADVDYVAQCLRDDQIDVLIDKEQIVAGKRLWSQIDAGISDPARSDAWAIYVTEKSLQSQPCQEELAYALDRALSSRGSDFPMIGIFPAHVDAALVPAALRVRLFVSLSDPDWRARVSAAAKREPLSTGRPRIAPTQFTLHAAPGPNAPDRVILEFRRRADVKGPIIVGVPESEAAKLGLVGFGPPGAPFHAGVVMNLSNGTATMGDGRKFRADTYLSSSISPTQSAYVTLQSMPSQFFVGVRRGDGSIEMLAVADNGPITVIDR